MSSFYGILVWENFLINNFPDPVCMVINKLIRSQSTLYLHTICFASGNVKPIIHRKLEHHFKENGISSFVFTKLRG